MTELSIISDELIRNVLKTSQKDDSISVINLSLQPAIDKGENYSSEVLRAVVEFSKKSEDEEIIEKISVIIKLIYTSSSVHKELVEEYGSVDSEIKMMTSTLVEMEKILGDTKLAARFLYGQKNPPIFIIEDLNALGYRMANREIGLDLQHSLVAIRGLAKFHASSLALCEKDSSIKKLYYRGAFFDRDELKNLKMYIGGGLKGLAKMIETWPELDQSYSEKIIKMSNGRLYELLTKGTALDEKEFNVLIHGDFWVNNMMFLYDENGQVKDHIFMDFQLPVYKCAAIDLNYFIQTSLTEEVLINHRDQIIKEYLNILTITMQRIGCETSPPTKLELDDMLRKYEFYSLYAAFVSLPVMMANKKYIKTVEEMMTEDGDVTNVGIDNPLFRKRLTRRLKIWNESGLLDI